MSTIKNIIRIPWYFVTGFIRCLQVGFLKIFGKIKISKYPMFIVYDPTPYKITGTVLRKIAEIAKPGDIICRRYEGYLDGYFIPGRFSHSGIYVGEGKMIHAMANGVQLIDIIDFCRCDGIAILRCCKQDINMYTRKACEIAKGCLGYPYDFHFDAHDPYKDQDKVEKRTEALYCHELCRSCYPDLDIPLLKPSIWNGMIRSNKLQYLAQSFFDSPDMELVYDSDFCEPQVTIK